MGWLFGTRRCGLSTHGYVLATNEAGFALQVLGVSGPTFGNEDLFQGLGVFLDSYDNDGQVATSV